MSTDGTDKLDREQRVTSDEVRPNTVVEVARTGSEIRVTIRDGIGVKDAAAGKNRHEDGTEAVSLDSRFDPDQRRPYRLDLSRIKGRLRTHHRGDVGEKIRSKLNDFYPPGVLVKDKQGRRSRSTLTNEERTRIVREMEKEKELNEGLNFTELSESVSNRVGRSSRRVRKVYREEKARRGRPVRRVTVVLLSSFGGGSDCVGHRRRRATAGGGETVRVDAQCDGRVGVAELIADDRVVFSRIDSD